MDFVIILSDLTLGGLWETDIKWESSTPKIISFIFFTTSHGYFPTDVSPESIIPSAPSITELATSLTSAREGVRLLIIDSIIWVAIITGIPAFLHFETNIFWFNGTSSAGISIPKSPLATIIPLETLIISSIFFIAWGFSIFEIIGIWWSQYLDINSLSSRTSFFDLTNERATQSKEFFTAKITSLMSFSVSAGCEILVYGRLTPFFDFNNPGCITLSTTVSFLSVERAFKIIFPSSIKTFSPALISFAKDG